MRLEAHGAAPAGLRPHAGSGRASAPPDAGDGGGAW